ncbi:DUF2975 domain-containing protein [Paenibacillus sp. SC116]|uniref:DUF2975 domain-containing protein n=1 Tax=Paenibacillus sp. SC116 TaxID=2968986 RepID=UPI00215A1994|nr:DUF2975 domain-containing protein [Paenibacillus sp. SC116]MCR8843320.1 DUF2975 domain-containing protein [Paenibacillus sp. SC116]
MKRGSTLFLKIAVFLMGAPIAALCVFFPMVTMKAAAYYQELAYLQYPALIVVYATSAAFFFALFQALRLLSYIDQNIAFSERSVLALKKIKCSAITISILFVAALPILYLFAEVDDAPGLIVIGLVIVFASTVIAVFAAVLQKLLQDAIDIKLENDLTV